MHTVYIIFVYIVTLFWICNNARDILYTTAVGTAFAKLIVHCSVGNLTYCVQGGGGV